MKWFPVSASRLQVQNGLIVSWNECLNLWSRRWLKFTRSRVGYFILLRTVALKNTIWSRTDELKDAYFIDILFCENKENKSKDFIKNLHHFTNTKYYTLSDKTMSDKSDEIFRWWRKFWPTKNFVQRIILSKTKFSNIVRIHKCLSIARILG